MIYIIIMLGIALIDIIIKYGIENITDGKFPRIMPHTKGNILIHRFHNKGLPFGFLKKHKELVRLLPLSITCMLIGKLSVILPRRRESRIKKLSYAMIIGGSISNLCDRFFRGYVVDYFSFNKIKLKKFRNIIYNLGDIAIIAGCGLLAVSKVFCRKK